MTKTNMVITMAPTAQVEETDLITPIVVGCLNQATRPIHFKVTIDKITDGKIKFVDSYKGTMVQIDELKKFEVVLESDDPQMWSIFRDMTRFVCGVTDRENPAPIPVKCYWGEIMERYHDQIETPPYFYTTEQYFNDPLMTATDTDTDGDSDSDDDLDGGIDGGIDGDLDDDTDDPDREERERQELDESRRERLRDIRAYYYDRI